MKKFMLIIVFSIILNADDKCNVLLNKYHIDTNIHSNIGWHRVCNNKLLNIYATGNISTKDNNYMCDYCFNGIDVGIGSTLRSEK